MARPRNQRRRREEIISVAATLLIREGVSGARLTDIARAAEVTPASISYYYPDLIDLYADVYRLAADRYDLLRRERVAAIEGPVDRLLACLRLGIPEVGRPTHEATAIIIELSAFATRERRFFERTMTFMDDQVALFRGIVDDGIARGVFAPRLSSAEIARFLLAAEDGFAVPVLIGQLTVDDAYSLMVRLAGDLLGGRFTDEVSRLEGIDERSR